MPQPLARTKQMTKTINAGKVRHRNALPADKENPFDRPAFLGL
jgi:hypothetical protein